MNQKKSRQTKNIDQEYLTQKTKLHQRRKKNEIVNISSGYESFLSVFTRKKSMRTNEKKIDESVNMFYWSQYHRHVVQQF